MKKISLLLCLFLANQFNSNAQATKWIKNRISTNLIENCEYTKTGNKKVKNGEAFIIDAKNAELARGNYKNGIKDSIWNFYGQTGDLIQVYDYTHAKLIYNTTDTKTIVNEIAVVDTTGYINAKLVAPRKIGGVNFGFNLLFNEKNLPIEVKQQTDNVLMEYVFTLTETGKLSAFSINYSSTFYNASFPQSITADEPDAFSFTPAYINDHPVKSKFIYRVMLYINQARDKGLYGVPTQHN